MSNIYCDRIKNYNLKTKAYLEQYEQNQISVFIPKEKNIEYVCLCIYSAYDSRQMNRWHLSIDENIGDNVCYKTQISFSKVGLYYYYFEVKSNGKIEYIEKEKDSNFGKFSNTNESRWQITIFKLGFKTSDSFKGGISYQIFPDRFCNSGTEKQNIPTDRKIHENWGEEVEFLPNENGIVTNSDYFGGDLIGIMQKLDYLKRLNVEYIYLNPIVEAHESHRYNAADYMNVDPLLGSNEDFKTLCKKASEYGIKIILDGVFNHTGSDSIYFNRNGRYETLGAYQSKDSEYRDFYCFKSDGTYESWWNFDTLPKLNASNKKVVNFICEVVKFWMVQGADGFRLDVVDDIPSHVLKRIRETIKSFGKDKILIGEVWEDASYKVAYGIRREYLQGYELDSTMNYPFKNAILAYIKYGNYTYFKSEVETIVHHYPKQVLDVVLNSLSTHDSVRFLTEIGSPELKGRSADKYFQLQSENIFEKGLQHAKSLFKLSSIIQFFFPGVPCIYYGDEVLMKGYVDPFNRRCYPWGSEDTELLSFFEKLTSIRYENKYVLSDAEFEILECNENVCIFSRKKDTEEIIICINRSDNISIDISSYLHDKKIIFSTCDDSDETNTLKPLSSIVIK